MKIEIDLIWKRYNQSGKTETASTVYEIRHKAAKVTRLHSIKLGFEVKHKIILKESRQSI